MKVDTKAVSNPAVSIEKSAELKKKAPSDVSAPTRSNEERFSDVSISDNAKLMQRALELVKTAPEIREDRVAALKQSIRSGQYKVDAGELTEKILDDHMSTHFGKNSF